MASIAGCIRRIASSGSVSSIRLVELLMSAKTTVRCLRSPPLMLRTRSTSSVVGRDERAARGVAQLPQNRLFGRLRWLHAAQTIPSGFPHVSQNAFVALLSLLQYRQSIRRDLEPSLATKPDYRRNDDVSMVNTRPEAPPGQYDANPKVVRNAGRQR